MVPKIPFSIFFRISTKVLFLEEKPGKVGNSSGGEIRNISIFNQLFKRLKLG